MMTQRGNRWDEINATAKDVADWVCANEQDRNQMADDLIKLVTLVVAAVGKSVAIEGEADVGMGDCTCDRLKGCSGSCTNPEHDAKAHNRYLIGERIQTAADKVQREASHDGADLERWVRDGGTPVWQPRGNAARLAGTADGPFRPGQMTRLAHEAADRMRDAKRNSRGNCHGYGEVPPSHATGCRVAAAQQADESVTTLQTWDGKVLRTQQERDTPQRHTFVTATDGDTGRAMDYQHCGVCGARCECATGSPEAYDGPDVDCPQHGDHIATVCSDPGTGDF